MPEKRATRKLSAILSADVEGYSRLMGEDELGTVRTLETYREMITEIIRNYNGRVVDSPGDNILAEFSSVVDAVECAVEIQNSLNVKNRDLPKNRKMAFRIGINLGDVIVEGERIYGDGVNIAARIEGLADGGGVCISKNVHDQLKNKLKFNYKYLGEHSVKNIFEPVQVYQVLLENDVNTGSQTLTLPDKPSIAVLPFVNMSGDPGQEYIADGISENIIATLSKISEMFVIARNSTFIYKGKSVKAQEVGRDLGVRYILEGSIQKAAERIRITAQLIDAVTGHHLWAERYDRSMEDFFDLQDEITHEIVVSLQIELTDGERARAYRRFHNLEAWGYFVQALGYFHRFTREDNAKARELAEQATQLDPDYALAWGLLGWTHMMDAGFGTGESSPENFKEAERLTEKSLAMDDSIGEIRSLLGYIRLFQRKYDMALAEGMKAVALDPNNAYSHSILAHTMLFSGDFHSAIKMLHKAMRLSPYYPDWFLILLGNAYFMLERYKEAIEAWKQHQNLIKKRDLSERRLIVGHVWLTAAYMRLGQKGNAKYHLDEVLRQNPNFTVENMRKLNPYRDPKHLDHILGALRDAGLPESELVTIPDKPSIAVLPFTNMSGDSEQEYFSDGITEEIITALSKIPKIHVIARNSTFTYKEKPVMAQQVGKELGVRYVLEGSVRKAANRLRVTAQLIDAVTGYHLWAERYERELKDIFALQDEITMEILTALQVELTGGEEALLQQGSTANLEAWGYAIKASGVLESGTKESIAKARALLEKAVSLDPDYAGALAGLALSHWFDARFGFSDSPQESIRQTSFIAQKVMSLDDNNPVAHALVGCIHLYLREYEQAIQEAERGIALGPSQASVHAILAHILRFSGKYDQAIAMIKKAMRLQPYLDSWYLMELGMSYYCIGRYEEARDIAEQFLGLAKKRGDAIVWVAHLMLAMNYIRLELEHEATLSATELIRLNPDFTLEMDRKYSLYKDPNILERQHEDLRKAGLK